MAATLDLGNLLVHLRMDIAQYERMMQKAEARMKRTASRMTSMGRNMTLMVSLPLKLVGLGAVKAFAQFDDAMTKSLAIMKNITPELRKEMEDLALVISKDSVMGAKKLARGYFFLASAGMDAQQSMKALGAINKFAVAGAFDLAIATTLAADSASAMGLKVRDPIQNLTNLTRVTDVLIGANTLANATTEQFAQSMTSGAGAAMKAYGIQLEEGVAVLAAYAGQGIKAQHAGNMFSRMLRLTTKGFAEHRSAWRRFGLDIYDVQGNMKPLETVVGDLSEVLASMSVEQRIATLTMLGFQARSQQAVFPLLNMQHKIKGYREELLKMKGITDDVAEKTLRSFSAQMKILWHNVVATGISIGRMLAPHILKLNKKIKDGLKIWESWEESTQKQVLGFIGLVSAIGPLLLGIGILMKVGVFLIATFKSISVAVMGLGVALASPLGGILLLATGAYIIRASWERGWDAIKGVLNDFTSFIGLFYDDIVTETNETTGEIEVDWSTTFDNIITRVKDFVADYKASMEGLKGFLQKVTDNIMEEGNPLSTEGPAKSNLDIISDFYNNVPDPEPPVFTFWGRLKKITEGGFEEFSKAFVKGREEAEKQLENPLESLKKAVQPAVGTMVGIGADVKDQMKQDFADISSFISNFTAELQAGNGDSGEYKFPFDPANQGFSAEDIAAVNAELVIMNANQLDLDAASTFEENTTALKAYKEEMLQVSRAALEMQEPLKDWADEVANVGVSIAETFANAFDSLGDSLADFVMTGKMNIKEWSRALIKEIIAVIIKAYIAKLVLASIGIYTGGPGFNGATNPLSAAGTGTSDFGSQGGNFNSADVPGFADGGVVTRPTLGMIGEGGEDEAVIPLKGGRVPVDLKGGGGREQPVVNIVINNKTNTNLKQEEESFFDGKNLIIGVVAENIEQGGALRGLIGNLR